MCLWISRRIALQCISLWNSSSVSELVLNVHFTFCVLTRFFKKYLCTVVMPYDFLFILYLMYMYFVNTKEIKNTLGL